MTPVRLQRGASHRSRVKHSTTELLHSLNQNICCGYSNQPSQCYGSFEHPQHMFKLTGKEINAILGAQTVLIWTYAKMVKGSNNNKKILAKNLCYTEVCYNGTALFLLPLYIFHFRYCKFGNYWENFIFANSVKRHISHIKNLD